MYRLDFMAGHTVHEFGTFELGALAAADTPRFVLNVISYCAYALLGYAIQAFAFAVIKL
jgi:hypothetical protein